ncbi:MAG: hypothetical protein WC766_06300 [Patescibacteria group bacterium]|jgi:hypothetical protein
MDYYSTIVTIALFFFGVAIGWIFSSPYNKARVKQLFSGKPQLVVLLAGENPSLVFSVVDKPLSTDPIKAKFGKQEMVLIPNPTLNKHVGVVECGLFDPADGRQIPMEALVHYRDVLTEEVDKQGNRKVVLAGFTNARLLGKLVGPSQLQALVNQYFAWTKNKALSDLKNNPIYTWLPWVTLLLALVAVLVSIYNVSLTTGLMNQVTALPGALNQTIGVARVG